MWLYNGKSKEYLNIDKMYGFSITERGTESGCSMNQYPYEITGWLTDGERFEKCNGMPIAMYNSKEEAEREMDCIYNAISNGNDHGVYLLKYNTY